MVSIVISLLWAMLIFCWMANPPLMLGLMLSSISCLMVKNFFLYGYRFIELFFQNSKQVSIILHKIVDLQFTLSHKGSVVT